MTRRPRKTTKVLPTFRTEARERSYWQRTDLADVVDWKRARWVTFPNLRPSTRTISLRLPASMIDELKTLANERDIPYQSLLKVFLAERIARERGSRAFRAGRGPSAANDVTGLERLR